MAKITFLGTSSSIPTPTRDNTSFILTHKNQHFLIDCPGSISHKLLQTGLDFTKIKNIIITHHHPDHLYGIISLIHTQAFRNKNLNIFSNGPSIKIIKKLIKIFELDKVCYPSINYFNVYKKPSFIELPDIKIQAIKNLHCKNSFGIKIFVDKKSFFYSSDTAFSRKTLKSAGKVELIIHDCTASKSFFETHPSLYKMHTCAQDLADYLENKSNITLIPIHFLYLNINEEKKVKKKLKKLKNRVIFVNDFDKINL